MSEQEKIFADGMIFTRRRDQAPDFVKGGVSIKVDEFVAFLQKHKKADGWVNLDLLQPQNREKRPYFQLNTWEPKKDAGQASPDNPDDVPF